MTPASPPPPRLRHSALGIAALGVSLLGLVLFLIASGLGLLLVQRHVAAEGLVMAPTLGVLGLVSTGLQGLALLLALGSLLQARRRRLPGVVALLLALVLLGSHIAAVQWAGQHWAQPAPAG
ncbi:hypothetical protein [Stenotrophomonas sp. 24(2023)]|uniref:hypothetical protein n=1 Tax=Stenotrophomonas sp. 24(2023) TaxID=3068324 RepID=UPI0027E16EFA|nr:hypothetical protein [Stenotrophomonas sp. 24(2023)]WMJ70457.1 hypothetical protein Q9R17_04970 [Stenotrophomonas sp. 24(2023)]